MAETTAVAMLPAVATAVAAKAATRLPRKSKKPCILRYEHLQAHPFRDAPVCFCTDKRTNPGNSKIEAPGKKPRPPKRKKKKGGIKNPRKSSNLRGSLFEPIGSPGGERGIRTPGALRLNGFRDRHNRPLCHLSYSGSKGKNYFARTQKIRPLFFFSKTKSPALSLSARRHPGSR